MAQRDDRMQEVVGQQRGKRRGPHRARVVPVAVGMDKRVVTCPQTHVIDGSRVRPLNQPAQRLQAVEQEQISRL
jgi:hypothetical protein